MNIIFHRSPNFDNNRKKIDRIVIHWFGKGTLESADNRFLNDMSDVSAHYGISGDTIIQWVEEQNVAYHAGNYEMNQRSIGIEHDATTDHQASDLTYETSAKLIANICKKYNIPLNDSYIIPHRQIKATQCPGTIDINRIISLASGIITEDMPSYLKTLFAENGLAVNNEGQVREFFEKAKRFDGLKTDLENCRKELTNPSTNSNIVPKTAFGQNLVSFIIKYF